MSGIVGPGRSVSHCRGHEVSAAPGRGGLSAGNTMPEVQQIGGTPDHVVLELADLAIGIDQLPHHFDDAKSALLIHRAHDDAGEMIEIDRLALDQGCRRDQLIRSTWIKPEAAFEQAVKLALFLFRW